MRIGASFSNGVPSMLAQYAQSLFFRSGSACRENMQFWSKFSTRYGRKHAVQNGQISMQSIMTRTMPSWLLEVVPISTSTSKLCLALADLRSVKPM